MQPSPESAAKMRPNGPAARLRDLPSVDELLSRPRVAALIENAGRSLVTQAARTVLASARARLKEAAGSEKEISAEEISGLEAIEARIVEEIDALLAPSLARVINATGVILHTNLGRAPLGRAAAAAIAATAPRYSNLEYDLQLGERGKRDVHTSRLLAEISGAESAIGVNNNGAAVLLVL